MASSRIFMLCISATILIACGKQNEDQTSNTLEEPKTIRLFAQAQPGGEAFEFEMPIDPGLDHLKIADPSMTEVEADELVLGMTINNQQYAIPIKYLSGFEVANLFLDSSNYLVTWCPLVGSARIFDGEIGGDNSGFDFGRGLMDNNLLIIDRKTHSVWNQLSCRSIEGELSDQKLSPRPSIQSTWAFWKSKYPETSLIVNTDTSNAVFPQFVLDKQYYNTWIPGEPYPQESGHQTDNLGLGIELGNSSAFLSLNELFKEESPIAYELSEQQLLIHFDQAGLTAWVENQDGELLTSTIVYDWAWNNFFPDSKGL